MQFCLERNEVNMRKTHKSQKGFTTVDVIIAVIIFAIFVPLITSLIYNIGISSKSIERTAKAVNYATQYLENAKIIGYQNITESNLKNSLVLESGYTADITVIGPKVTAVVKYKVGKEEKEVCFYTNI